MSHALSILQTVTSSICPAMLAALAALLLACTGAAAAQEAVMDPTRMQTLPPGPTTDAPSRTGVEALPGSELWVQARLITTYSLNEDLSPFDINVEVEGDKVILTGTVETAAQRDLAGTLARDTSGISEVDNRLGVALAGDVAAPASSR